MLKLEKNLFIVVSAVLAVVFILFTFLFSTIDFDARKISEHKTIYYVDNISRAHQKVINRFNELNRGNIKVETINLSFEKFSTNERKELLARYLRSKNDRIDVFAVDQIWVPRFARWAVPLQALLDSSEISSIIPNALKTCWYNNNIIAVPLYIDIAVMFYRSDLLDKSFGDSQIEKRLKTSITWEELIELSNGIKNSRKPFYFFQADDYEGLLCAFTELMANQNNPIIDSAGNVLVNTPEGKKSLQLLVDLVNKYGVSPREVTNLKENESFKLFGEQNGLLLRAWSSMFDERSEYLSPEVTTYLKMAPVPHFSKTKLSSVYGGWNLMISKFSKNIPEAKQFIKYMLSEESQTVMYEEGGYLPTNKNIYRDQKFLNNNEEIIFFNNLLSSGVYRPFLEGYTYLSDIISYYLNIAIKSEMTVEKALEEAERKILAKEILVK